MVHRLSCHEETPKRHPQPKLQGISSMNSRFIILLRQTDFLSKLAFNVQFDLLEMELGNDLGFARTRSHGTIVPKGQKTDRL